MIVMFVLYFVTITGQCDRC